MITWKVTDKNNRHFGRIGTETASNPHGEVCLKIDDPKIHGAIWFHRQALEEVRERERPAEPIVAMCEHGNQLYVATATGLYRLVHDESGERFEVVPFGETVAAE